MESSPDSHPPRDLWRRADRRRVALLVVAGALVALVVLGLGDEAAHHLHQLEHSLAELGALGPVVLVLAMVLFTSVFVPDTVFALLAGGLFGLGSGTLWVVCGGLLGAVLQFGLGRRWLSGYVERLVAARPSLAGVQRAVRGEPLRMQVLLRLTPLSPTLVTYVLGATDVRFGTFCLSCLALLPVWFSQVYIGYAGRKVVAGAAGGRDAWVDTGLVVLGLVALLVVSVLVSRAAQRGIAAAEQDVAA